MLNILITSIGRRSYIINYFKEALYGIGQVHASNNKPTYALTLADHSVITPSIFENCYPDFLLNYCLKYEIKAVLSLFDIDIPVLAKNKERFWQFGIKMIVPNEDFANICNDKWLSYQFFNEYGFRTPKTFLSIEECSNQLRSGEIFFPLLIKPRWGMGSIGIYVAESPNELEVFYQLTKREVFQTYLKYESSQDRNKSVLIQEKLCGDEYGLNLFNDFNGELLSCIMLKKIAMRAGETDCAEIIHKDSLLEIGKALSSATKHPANLDVDCFLVGDDFFLLEMNCRLGGQYPFCHLAGTDFPKAIVNMLIGKPVPKDILFAESGVIGYKDLVPVTVKDGR